MLRHPPQRAKTRVRAKTRAYSFLLVLNGLVLGVSTAASAVDDTEPRGEPANRFSTVPFTRETLLREVLRSNPELHALEELASATNSDVGIATAWADPTLATRLAPATLVTPFFDGPEPGISLRIAQKMKWPMRQKASGDEARHLFEASKGRVNAGRLSLALNASLRFDDYWVASQSVAIQQDVIALARQTEETAQTVYRSGQGSQQDPLEARTERIHAEHELHNLERDRATARTRLNRLMNRKPWTALAPPTTETLRARPRREAGTFTREQHPRVQIAQAEFDAASERRRFESWRYLPNVEVSATFNSMWPMLSHQLMVGIAVTLPVQVGAREAALAGASAKTRAARYRWAAAERVVQEEQLVAEAQLDDAKRIERLLRTQLLPTATIRAEAALVGYTNGENAFGVALQAARHLADVRLQLIRAKADINRAVARLAYAHGKFPTNLEEEEEEEEEEEGPKDGTKEERRAP